MKESKEGEIIFVERFGSTTQERFYVKPFEQTSAVLVKVAGARDVTSWFTKIFLPQAYPESVSKDYLAYQIWDTAQAFCSTISGILATQEVLRGVGVGDKNATPLAATITWVLKDGCGHIGRILLAFTHGCSGRKFCWPRCFIKASTISSSLFLIAIFDNLLTHFDRPPHKPADGDGAVDVVCHQYLDAYSKKWRMYADILNNAAMCIEIALPQFKVYSLFALCISTVMKAIVGVAGGATRVAMTQHHAILGNLADVSAKDSAQETAVNLVASLVSLFIISQFGSSLAIFMLMMVLHVMFNYFAVRAVCLRTLNEPRFLLLIDKYLRQEVIATPCEINRIEPIIFYQLGPCILDLKICGFKIDLGRSLNKVLGGKTTASHMCQVRQIYGQNNYILVQDIRLRKMHVMLKQDAAADDILRAYFHAVLLAVVTCAINDEPLAIYKNQDRRPFAQLCATLQSAEWSREEAHSPHWRFAYNPSSELLQYLNKVVAREWPRVRLGLNKTGWDLSKHLLITDQWRIANCASTKDTESLDMNSSPHNLEEVEPHDDPELSKKILEELLGMSETNPINLTGSSLSGQRS